MTGPSTARNAGCGSFAAEQTGRPVPIYDYACSKCRRVTEVIHGINDHGPKFCPECGAEGTMTKSFVAPTVHFKGTGWAKKDRGTAARSQRSKDEKGTGDGDGTGSGAGSEATKSDTTKSDVPKSETTKSENTKSENTQSDAPKSNAGSSGSSSSPSGPSD